MFLTFVRLGTNIVLSLHYAQGRVSSNGLPADWTAGRSLDVLDAELVDCWNLFMMAAVGNGVLWLSMHADTGVSLGLIWLGV
jgi:hypothetical protein